MLCMQTYTRMMFCYHGIESCVSMGGCHDYRLPSDVSLPVLVRSANGFFGLRVVISKTAIGCAVTSFTTALRGPAAGRYANLNR
jgi:hypothetical protein